MYDQLEHAEALDAASPADTQSYWSAELVAAKKELEKFQERGRKVYEVYLDNRADASRTDRKFNLFNTNVSILMSALFARIPRPEVGRRFNEPDDDVGRVASTILERALTTELETDGYFTTTAKAVIKDHLIPGVGIAWVRYQPTVGEPQQITDDLNAELAEEETASPIISDEATPVEHVNWEDVLWSPCRTWNECRWVGRRAYLAQDEFTERFGEEKAAYVPFDNGQLSRPLKGTNADGGPQNVTVQHAEVWELWCKTTKKVYFFCEFCPELLDIQDDPFGLPGFFPTPKPLVATTSTGNFIPIADYVLIQDQYEELNTINARISNLVRACKVAGAYDKANPAIKNVLSSGAENVLVPVDRWDAFSEKGGLKGSIDLLPIDEISKVIAQLNAAREVIKQQIYELTGISDIVRGASSPYETAAAQQMKGQYASLRLQTKQQDVAEYFSDIIKIKAFLMSKFYEPERLLQRAGRLNAADAQLAPAALQLLKDELTSHFTIEVSVDALQLPNWAQDKAERTELLTALSNMLREALPAAQAMPETAPLFLNLIKFGVSSFRGAKEVEGVIDQGLQQLMLAGPQGEKPDPAADAQQAQAAAQQQQAQADAQLKQAELQANSQFKQAELQANSQFKQAELQLKNKELDIKAAELRLKELELSARGIDTSELSLPVGEGMQSQRLTKEEFLLALQQMQQGFITAVNALVNTPVPDQAVVVERDANGRLVGQIQTLQ